MYPELEAFEAQCDELDSLIGELEDVSWERPTRCPPLSVRELVAHVARGLYRTADALANDAAGDSGYDRVSWWRYGESAADIARGVVEGGVEEAGKRTDDELALWLRECAGAARERAKATPPDRVVQWRGQLERTIRADELIATRVLEVGVHTMDLGHATLKGERIHPDAVPVVTRILDGLLGSPLPKAIGWDPRTYVLTGTGRRPFGGNERQSLGPLADRFPLVR